MHAVLYSRRGCHLCEAAEDMLAAWRTALDIEVVDVDAGPESAGRYGERVPVLLVDGEIVMEGRFDEAVLVKRLAVRGKSHP
jgi:glutaredoxin